MSNLAVSPLSDMAKNMVVGLVLKLHAKNIIITLIIINRLGMHLSISISLKIQLWLSIGKTCQIWQNPISVIFGSGDTDKSDRHISCQKWNNMLKLILTTVMNSAYNDCMQHMLRML